MGDENASVKRVNTPSAKPLPKENSPVKVPKPLVTNKQIVEEMKSKEPSGTAFDDKNYWKNSDYLDFKPEESEYWQNLAPDEKAKIIKKLNDINGLPISDSQKVIKYNEKYPQSDYVIVDKEKCTMGIYNPKGIKKNSYEVFVGKDKGDGFAQSAGDEDFTVKKTVPGEYVAKAQRDKDGDSLSIGGPNESQDPEVQKTEITNGKQTNMIFVQSIHTVAPFDNSKIGNGTLEDNRLTDGCVCMTEEQYKNLTQKDKITEGSHVYILPEEKENKLVLVMQKDGSYRFITDYNNPNLDVKAKKNRDHQLFLQELQDIAKNYKNQK